jgi:CheY-like chemotaxis protein
MTAEARVSGGLITIATTHVVGADISDLEAGAYVRILVSDTGPGMNPETAARAFEPFFTTKNVGAGTGLGLSQVYGFARQAGGDARISSTPGKGTTVEILLPLSKERRPSRQTASDLVPLRPAREGEVILVVEDEPALLDLAVESLQDLGYTTLSAENADKALGLLRSTERIDVLFSDILMPGGMNGVQLSVEARRLRPGLKVLLASGYAPTLFGHDVPNDVLLITKPYDQSKLATQLRAVLQP